MHKWSLACGIICLSLSMAQATGQDIQWRPAGQSRFKTGSASSQTATPSIVSPALPPAKIRGKIVDDVPGPIAESVVLPGMRTANFQDIDPTRGWVLVDESGSILFDDGGLVEGSWQILPFHRFYVQGEYLYWWTRGQTVPPLVTTAPAEAPEDTRGALGAPGTRVLFGGSRLNAVGHSGARISAGYWCDDFCQWAVEGNYFFLAQGRQRFEANSDQFPVLARPIFNVNTGAQDRQLTASPGTNPGDAFNLTGRIVVDLTSRLQGAELNVKRVCREDYDYRFNVLAGFRYVDLQEGLNIVEAGQSLRAVAGTNLFDPGTQFIVRDSFNTRNQFYGAQIGASLELQRDRWFLEGRVKLALGVTHQTVTIDGSQTFLAPNGTQSNFTGGLLAVGSNIGRFSQNRFSVVPELGLKVGYQLTENVRVFVGYDFLYWTSVLRPGDQVDLNVNVTQVPNFCQDQAFCPPNPSQRPAVLFRTSDFWAQGVSAGVEIRY